MLTNNKQPINKQPMQFSQQGVGLLEVLISLLLLGIAALGYSALQAQSLQSTGESLTRTQAITILRATAERIRINAIDTTFHQTVATNSTPALNIGQAMTAYQTLFASSTLPAKQTCTTGCSIAQTTMNDVREMKLAAQQYDINIGMAACPGTASAENSFCLIAAWNDTTATVGSGNTDCMNSEGKYRLDADCIYMEAY